MGDAATAQQPYTHSLSALIDMHHALADMLPAAMDIVPGVATSAI
jgi:hypothetical protein